MILNNKLLFPVECVERTILLVRGQKVIMDADLAKLYGVTKKRLNQQVKRNSDRFPEDFMFKFTQKEKDEVVVNATTSPVSGSRQRFPTPSQNMERLWPQVFLIPHARLNPASSLYVHL